ncbi:hypothetical protein [Williamsia sterculiae]|uniref:SnoaL-like domain-containing protein n=1 Tax=Williamsia sterculiae TaxID=1344003 RepID=A0A1N7HES8_9NOCA|nr:hypothetical protein [Williamsia sterculiae]SIS23386.1 hypothetical protein SAMN05445060_4109 [Williamsia sterculiae]
MSNTNLSAALHDLLDHKVLLDTAIEQHFAPDYRQCTNGAWDDREGFVEHIAHLRTIVARAEISVLNELTDGDQYAERHVARMVKVDGSTVTQEVFVFAQFAPDGRFSSIEEVTNMLAGAESDRGIGNAR